MWCPQKCTWTLYLRTSESQRVINSFKKALVASVHCKACIISEKESLQASKSRRKPDRLLPAERTASVQPKAVSHWQGNPTCIQHLENPAGLQCGTNRPLEALLNVMKGSKKSKQTQLLWEVYGKLKGTTIWVIQEKCKAPQTIWEAWGHAKDSPRRNALH